MSSIPKVVSRCLLVDCKVADLFPPGDAAAAADDDDDVVVVAVVVVRSRVDRRVESRFVLPLLLLLLLHGIRHTDELGVFSLKKLKNKKIRRKKIFPIFFC